jgi:3D (Asp-Asp-Asp) domain-containing protein
MIIALINSQASDMPKKNLSQAGSFAEALELAKIHQMKFSIIKAKSTSYAYVDKDGKVIANDYTKSGDDFLPGFSISVYPAQIPFGSVLYIEGYGWGKASDTGDDITWGRIDVSHYCETDSNNWGVKQVKVINFGKNFSSDQINNLKKAKKLY